MPLMWSGFPVLEKVGRLNEFFRNLLKLAPLTCKLRCYLIACAIREKLTTRELGYLKLRLIFLVHVPYGIVVLFSISTFIIYCKPKDYGFDEELNIIFLKAYNL